MKAYVGTHTAVVLKCGHTCWCRFCACVPWLPPRSWVCRGQSAVCCWGGATQRCQGKQVSVGAAAARPEAVHGENDAVPIVMLPLQLIQGVQHLGRGAYHLPTVCLLSLARCSLTSCSILFQALRVEPHHSYDVQQGKGPIFSRACPDFSLFSAFIIAPQLQLPEPIYLKHIKLLSFFLIACWRLSQIRQDISVNSTTRISNVIRKIYMVCMKQLTCLLAF